MAKANCGNIERKGRRESKRNSVEASRSSNRTKVRLSSGLKRTRKIKGRMAIS